MAVVVTASAKANVYLQFDADDEPTLIGTVDVPFDVAVDGISLNTAKMRTPTISFAK